MTELPFKFFDCDTHYYEALDAFTRHIEPEYKKRAMQWAEVDGRTRLLVGGKVNKFIPLPTFEFLAKPGALDEYFRGRNPRGEDLSMLFGEIEPIRAEYRDRDVRLEVMDRQGMQAAILLPTLGVGMEYALRHDIPALTAAFRAFNRWLDEDWGFSYKDRIFAAPYITLADPQNAVRELEWALERDARFLVMIPGPVLTEVGGRAPAHPMFDDFWQLANDSGITVCYHSGENALLELHDPMGRGRRNPVVQRRRRHACAVLSRSPAGYLCEPPPPGAVPPLPEPANGVHRERLGVGVPLVRKTHQVLRSDSPHLP